MIQPQHGFQAAEIARHGVLGLVKELQAIVVERGAHKVLQLGDLVGGTWLWVETIRNWPPPACLARYIAASARRRS